eukprot:scaffold551_cov195-Chaetoceros_neogracile.AAC.1
MAASTNTLLKIIGAFIFATGAFNLLLGFKFVPEHSINLPTSTSASIKKVRSAATKVKKQAQKPSIPSDAAHSKSVTVQTDADAKKEDDAIGSTHFSNSKNHQLVTDQNHKLPKWITDYFDWHSAMRKKFPGDEIFTNPDAPPIIIRKCIEGLCGGLHDRLGQLPFDLYLANQTKRMFFIHWQTPYPMERFLVPPDLTLPEVEYSFDWRMPSYYKYGTKCSKRKECLQQWHRMPELEGNVQGQRRGTNSGKSGADLIEEGIYNLTKGIFKDTKAVAFEILVHLHEDLLEKILKELGETDMIHKTPSFGKIFLSFFSPSKPVQTILDDVNEDLGLVSNEYSAVHCRVRHPFGYSKAAKFHGIYAAKADRYIPDFDGMFKDTMVETAIKAIKCAATKDANAKMYFMSDMSDLVEYMAFNVTDDNYVSSHPEWFQDQSSTNVTAKNLMTKFNIVARKQNTQNLHIDKAKMTDVENFYGAFVDIFLGIHAKCVSYGIGFYAAFAAKISGTECVVKYALEKYGGSKGVASSNQELMCKEDEANKMVASIK